MVTGCEPRFFHADFAGHKIAHAYSNMIQTAQKTMWIRRVFSADLQGNTAPDTEPLFQREPYIQYLVPGPASVCATQKLLASRPRFFQVRNRNIRMLLTDMFHPIPRIIKIPDSSDSGSTMV